jgi:type I site-specific restriction-modification system R (restriction) subunit
VSAVHIRTSLSSTAKCTTQRPNSNIHAPDDAHGQDDVGILATFEEIAQNIVGDAPDKGDDSVVRGLVHAHPGEVPAQLSRRPFYASGPLGRRETIPSGASASRSIALASDPLVNISVKRYLIQHSAGSGKSNSIAWLAHQLIGLKRDAKEVFASVIVVTDAKRDKLDPILDACVAVYVERLDEDAQVAFKGKAKVFCRTYSFLSSVIPYSNAAWEKLSIMLNLLTPKLPAPREEDLSKGILEAIDMDSYRVEKKAAMKIALADKDAEIEPVPTDVHGHKPEPELDRLSNILKAFNEHFGTLFIDTDRVAKRIRDDIAPKVAADTAYQNAKENTPHTARIAHDQALGKAMQHLLKDDTQVYKQFMENESFRRFVGDMVYQLTSQ